MAITLMTLLYRHTKTVRAAEERRSRPRDGEPIQRRDKKESDAMASSVHWQSSVDMDFKTKEIREALMKGEINERKRTKRGDKDVA